MKELWDKIWSKQPNLVSRYRRSVQNEMISVRWKKIEDEALKMCGSFKGLKVVELGSGTGTASMIMSLKGAEATLLDYSEVALERAQKLFKEFKCDAKFFKIDCLKLPDELLSKFDISISLGLAEHFIGIQRRQIFQSHFSVLKDKGISFISVPNKLCLPYRFWKRYLELRHAWVYGTEVPFTHSELRRLVSDTGFKSCKIVGSSFLNSIDRFLFSNIFYRAGITTEIPSLLDDFLGYALVLIGYKNDTVNKGVGK